jgi:transcriptional regulator with XRE-family HTH domain
MPDHPAATRYPACDPAKIKARRVALGLRQDQVAHLGACSQGHLSLIETGRRRPSADILTSIAKALGCTVEDFAPAEDAA